MKYKVQVTETESRSAIVEVDADGEAEACAAAEEIVCNWESEEWEDSSESCEDLTRASRIIEAAAAEPQEAEPVYEPGVYSAFVLRDDGTWTQPSFRLTAPATEEQIHAALIRDRDSFYVAGLQADDNAGAVADLKL